MYRLIMKHTNGRDEYVTIRSQRRDAMFHDLSDAYEAAILIEQLTNVETVIFDDTDGK